MFQTTGKRVDSNSRLFPIFAVMLGQQRKAGGDVDESYLKSMKVLYAGTPDGDGLGFVPTFDRALNYLTANKPGGGHVDLRG